MISTSSSSGIGQGMFSIGSGGNNFLNLDVTGIITLGESNNAHLTINNTTGVLEFYSNDPYFLVDGGNRRFQLGDYTQDWYGTFIDVNDDSSLKQISLHATKVTMPNLAPYTNNAAAIAGGLTTGDLYYTNVAGDGVVKIVI